MAATRASGTNAVRYGTMREAVLSLKVVPPDGKVISHRPPRAQVGGGLRPHPAVRRVRRHARHHHRSDAAPSRHPRDDLSAVCGFETLPARSIPSSRRSSRACRSRASRSSTTCRCARSTPMSKLDFPEQPTLFFEFHGSPAGVAEQVETVARSATRIGGGDFPWSTCRTSNAGCGRRGTRPIMPRSSCGRARSVWATDVCVPIELAAAIEARTQRIDAAGLPATILGHVGDGNFHVIFALDPATSPTWPRRGDQRGDGRPRAGDGRHLHRRARHRHRQAEALLRELGDDAVALMRASSRRSIPPHLFNPGKIFEA